MNLEQLRKQAKELVRAARAGDEAALSRIRAHAPSRERVALADAQLTLAREKGYPSWPALGAAAEASAEAFVLAATDRHRSRAEALLAARPEIEIRGRVLSSVAAGPEIPTSPAAHAAGRRSSTSATHASPRRSSLVSCSHAALIRMPPSRTNTGTCRRCTAPPASRTIPS